MKIGLRGLVGQPATRAAAGNAEIEKSRTAPVACARLLCKTQLSANLPPISDSRLRIYPKLLRRRGSLPLRLILPGSTAAVTLPAHHLLILLLLIGIQNRLDLARRILPNLHHLAHAILL